jgi:hypothetical protein
VGLCGAVSVAVSRGQPSAQARSADGFQRGAVCSQDRRAVEVSTQRSASLVRDLSADAALAPGRCFAEEVQQVTGNNVELAYVDQGYTGPNAAETAEQHGLRLEVVKHPMAKRGFVLLPRKMGGRTPLRLGSPAPQTRQRLTNGSIQHSKAYTCSPSPYL